MPYHPVTGEI